jgi:hypothetical protein
LTSRLTFNKGGHAYKLDGHPVVSVTQLLDQLSKPALVQWAANEAADYAIDQWDELAMVPLSDRRRLIAGAHRANRDRAAAKGTAVHDMAERLLGGAPVDVPDVARAQVEGLARWIETSGVTVVHSESKVWSDADDEIGLCAYAGTLDAILKHPTRGQGLVDWKTGSGVYRDMALQVAGYAATERLIADDGEDRDMPHVDWLGVVHIRPDAVTLHTLTRAEWEHAHERFQLLRALHLLAEPTWTQEISA